MLRSAAAAPFAILAARLATGATRRSIAGGEMSARSAKRRDVTGATPRPLDRPEKALKHADSGTAGGGIAGRIPVHPARWRVIQGPGEACLAERSRSVLYWMSRDQRVQDNWALLYAQQLARNHGKTLIVVFNLVPKFLDATLRQYAFMLRGLQEVESDLRRLGIPFFVLVGLPATTIPSFVEEKDAGALVCDFSPMRTAVQWKSDVGKCLPNDVLFVEVDAHNIVPAWEASEKQEVGARTLRKKVMDRLPEFGTLFPEVEVQSNVILPEKLTDWGYLDSILDIDRSVGPVSWLKPGPGAALIALDDFCEGGRLKAYAESRNDPNLDATSRLSPYFHFGQLSGQRAYLCVLNYRSRYRDSVASFIEESVVRRELSDNFCLYNPRYDQLSGAALWAQDSLKLHLNDERERLYCREQLERAETHSCLWNAAQLQMVQTGHMHGFLRMFWAKCILYWSRSPEEALETALFLNDRYELDGRDPNGYVGCMWSICGVHDMG